MLLLAAKVSSIQSIKKKSFFDTQPSMKEEHKKITKLWKIKEKTIRN